MGEVSISISENIPADRLWDRVWHDPVTGEPERWNYLAELIAQELLPHLPRGGWCAEAGAGSGRLAAHACAAHGSRALYLDFSRASLRFLAARGDGCAVGGDVRALPLRDGTLACCFSSGVIEHFSAADQQRILAEQVRAVCPKGSVVVLAPYRTRLFLLGKRLLERLGRWPFGYEEPLASFRPLWPADTTVTAEYTFGFFMLWLGLLKTLRLTFLYRPLDALLLALWRSPLAGAVRPLDRLLARLLGGYLILGAAQVR